jgi:hypothetical protein
MESNENQLQLRRQVEELTAQLEQAKQVVQQWTDSAVQLSRDVAEKRAENQMRGRTLGSAFLGSGYRARERHLAVLSNARIAKETAEKRSTIALKKKQAQELVRSVRSQLAVAKKELALATKGERAVEKRASAKAETAADAISLLHKLKEAHEAGLLTDAEYEQKRKDLTARI